MKTKFRYRFDYIKANIERLERVIGNFLRNYSTTTVVLMAIVALNIGILYFFEQCETHAQLKEREAFWQHRLKTCYPIGIRCLSSIEEMDSVISL